jgi:hypothetical protein
VIPDSPFDPKNERLRDVNGANDPAAPRSVT